MSEKLVVKNLYKVFGDRPEEAMKLVAQGKDKETIFKQTGHTLGVIDASFTVNEGEIFVVMGLSGSGKSTLVRLLNRLIEPTAGQVLINGRDIAAMDDETLRTLRRTQVSMVFQSFALMPHMNVVDNTAFGLELGGMAEAERRARAMEALEQVGLAQWAKSYPDELSGGMQQRVGLARALANDPEVLLMDEAFSALDPLIRTEMQDELVKLQAAHKRTIIFISHDLDEAIRIGDRIAIMQGGVVVQVGTAEDDPQETGQRLRALVLPQRRCDQHPVGRRHRSQDAGQHHRARRHGRAQRDRAACAPMTATTAMWSAPSRN